MRVGMLWYGNVLQGLGYYKQKYAPFVPDCVHGSTKPEGLPANIKFVETAVFGSNFWIGVDGHTTGDEYLSLTQL